MPKVEQTLVRYLSPGTHQVALVVKAYTADLLRDLEFLPIHTQVYGAAGWEKPQLLMSSLYMVEHRFPCLGKTGDRDSILSRNL